MHTSQEKELRRDPALFGFAFSYTQMAAKALQRAVAVRSKSLIHLGPLGRLREDNDFGVPGRRVRLLQARLEAVADRGEFTVIGAFTRSSADLGFISYHKNLHGLLTKELILCAPLGRQMRAMSVASSQ